MSVADVALLCEWRSRRAGLEWLYLPGINAHQASEGI
jgi:hypothetical protein